LTNQQLADIGINRSDIDRLIWLEEDKTMRGRGNEEFLRANTPDK